MLQLLHINGIFRIYQFSLRKGTSQDPVVPAPVTGSIPCQGHESISSLTIQFVWLAALPLQQQSSFRLVWVGGLCQFSDEKVSVPKTRDTYPQTKEVVLIQEVAYFLWVRSIGTELSTIATFRQEIKSLDPWLLIASVPLFNRLRWITDDERHCSWGCQQGPHSGDNGKRQLACKKEKQNKTTLG